MSTGDVTNASVVTISNYEVDLYVARTVEWTDILYGVGNISTLAKPLNQSN